MTHYLKLPLAVLVAFTSCTAPHERAPAQEVSALVDGTPEAAGVLALVNAPSTNLAILDHDVGLDRRAAENIITFRNGADGIAGNGDDLEFASIAQLDAIKWVGPSALNKLQAYAEAGGWVPGGNDLLGVFDNVAFTIEEATATLTLANTATETELDDDVKLDKRAAKAIVLARPITTLLQLSGVYFVGQSALLKLREYPKASPGSADGEVCAAHDNCASELCVGLTIYPEGWCAAESMADEFTYDEAIEIPDGDANGFSVDMTFNGLATVPVDVVVTIDVNHPHPEDLIVALHQPGGGYEILWNHEANPPTQVSAGWGIERDNMVNGVWTIDVIDTVSGNAGELLGVSLWLSSNYD
jgi:DNA uptake protein ComE-like DNA-binding protein